MSATDQGFMDWKESKQLTFISLGTMMRLWGMHLAPIKWFDQGLGFGRIGNVSRQDREGDSAHADPNRSNPTHEVTESSRKVTKSLKKASKMCNLHTTTTLRSTPCWTPQRSLLKWQGQRGGWQRETPTQIQIDLTSHEVTQAQGHSTTDVIKTDR